MTDDERHAWALYRYRCISGLVDPAATPADRQAWVRLLRQHPPTTPQGVPRMPSARSLRRWCQAYRQGGFDALRPQHRSDVGQRRTMPPAVWAQAVALKRAVPARSAEQVLQLLAAWAAVFAVLGWRDGGWHGLLQKVVVARQLGLLTPASIRVMRGWEYVLAYVLLLMPSMAFFTTLAMLPSVLSRRPTEAVLISIATSAALIFAPALLFVSWDQLTGHWWVFTPLVQLLSAGDVLSQPGPSWPGQSLTPIPIFGLDAAWWSVSLMLGWDVVLFVVAGMAFASSDIW